MKKINQLIFAAILVFSTCLNAGADQLSHEEKEALISSYKYWKSIGSGIGSNAVKSPFGRYLLLRNEDTLLCLKLDKHLPSVKEHGKAAKYSWVHLVAGKAEASGTFVIDEDASSAAASQGAYWIDIAGFKCEWSFGDWVYFDENLPSMKIAVTEFTEESEIEKEKVKRWLSRNELKSFSDDDPHVKLLERALKIEPDEGGNSE